MKGMVNDISTLVKVFGINNQKTYIRNRKTTGEKGKPC